MNNQQLLDTLLQKCKGKDPKKTRMISVTEFRQDLSTTHSHLNNDEIKDKMRDVAPYIEEENKNINYLLAIEFLVQNP